MNATSKKLLCRFFWALQICAAVLALAPIFLFMIWFNYTVDRSGLFQGDRFERETALMLINGNDVSGYEQMDERQISKLIIQNIDKAPTTVALGSSRILQLTNTELKSKSFYNFGMIGADYKDVFNTYYLLEKAEKLPKNIIIGFDAWYLNQNAIDERSSSELYAAFLHEMGENSNYAKKDTSIVWKELFSPGYFQGCLEYYFRDTSLEKHPSPVIGDLYEQSTEIKRGDGSVLYTKELRESSLDSIAHSAMLQAETFLRMDDYDGPSAEMTRLFDKLIDRMQKNGCNVIFVLTPYQHTLWDLIAVNPERWSGFFKTEKAVRELALRNNVPVYGSYNPYAVSGLERDEFYDGLHVKNTGIAKLFPGIQKAALNIKKHHLPEALPYNSAGPSIG